MIQPKENSFRVHDGNEGSQSILPRLASLFIRVFSRLDPLSAKTDGGTTVPESEGSKTQREMGEAAARSIQESGHR